MKFDCDIRRKPRTSSEVRTYDVSFCDYTVVSKYEIVVYGEIVGGDGDIHKHEMIDLYDIEEDVVMICLGSVLVI